ncbi:ArfGap-domain-containing protein [Xylariomycetidae sp. FL0641]|nr:ArfGap-domain-containing protein [Xylariomycetidae sp. FL0641]
MSNLMSKRQQARNEKVLQDLVQNVPGNNVCADCSARNPAWASWSLGIFLCMRCAAIHRKLGTHISKVKSLSMDSWTNEQVEAMKRTGNAASNRKHNPTNKQPPIPVDADEADSAMERFIRAKYVQGPAPTNGARRPNSGSSDEGTPPPLPPKTGNRFFKPGALSFRSKKEPRSPRDSNFGGDMQSRNSDHLRNKPSKVFGASVHQESPEATAQKLTQLRDMGFTDDKRNAMILKGVNGNLEKTIEALVRLGEGGGVSPLPRDSTPLSRSLTPQPTSQSAKTVNGLSRPSTTATQRPATPSNNPWDIPPAQPQSSQSTGTLQHNNPFYNNNNNNNTTNPFGMPDQQAHLALNQSLQNLSLGAPAQHQLFPHHTGGAFTSQPAPQPAYPQSMTPPAPQTADFASLGFNSNQTYPPPMPQIQQQHTGYNPFLQAPGGAQPSLSLNTSPFQNQGGINGSNPFAKSPTRMASPLNQIPEQSQQNVYNSSYSQYGMSNPFLAMNQITQSPQPQSTMNPWSENQQPQQPQQASYQPTQAPPQPQQQQAYQPQQQQAYQSQQQQAYQPQQQQAYQPQRADTASIMALFNYPQLAPQRPQAQEQTAPAPEANAGFTPQAQAPAAPTPQQPSALPGTKNPFLNNGAAPASGGARSRESMNLGMEMSWNNGRHSPDAFASLSARSG